MSRANDAAIRAKALADGMSWEEAEDLLADLADRAYQEAQDRRLEERWEREREDRQ